MIDVRKKLIEWLQNIIVNESQKKVNVNNGWYELKRRSQPQITVTLNNVSSDIDSEIGYDGPWEWSNNYMVRVWAPNANVRDWYYKSILKAVKVGVMEVGSDEDNVVYDLMLSSPPIKIEKTEQKTHDSGADLESKHLWENYGAIFYIDVGERVN